MVNLLVDSSCTSKHFVRSFMDAVYITPKIILESFMFFVVTDRTKNVVVFFRHIAVIRPICF